MLKIILFRQNNYFPFTDFSLFSPVPNTFSTDRIFPTTVELNSSFPLKNHRQAISEELLLSDRRNQMWFSYLVKRITNPFVHLPSFIYTIQLRTWILNT